MFEYFTEWLSKDKISMLNPKKAEKVICCSKKAKELFPYAEVEIHDDPLQTGSLFVWIKDIELKARYKRELILWNELFENCSNFEIYPMEDNLVLSICFNSVLRVVEKEI